MHTSIVVVDDFLADPMETRAEAMRMPFQEHPDLHKGRRAPGGLVPEGIAACLLNYIDAPPRSMLNAESYACFQVCTAGTQVVFHSDAQRWAGCIYLTPDAPPASGLSFYRSRSTGVRSSDELNVKGGVAGGAELERRTYDGKLLDRTAWQEVDRVGNVFNRLVVWDAHLIHAATDYFGTDLDTGRLFMMIFFDVLLRGA